MANNKKAEMELFRSKGTIQLTAATELYINMIANTNWYGYGKVAPQTDSEDGLERRGGRVTAGGSAAERKEENTANITMPHAGIDMSLALEAKLGLLGGTSTFTTPIFFEVEQQMGTYKRTYVFEKSYRFWRWEQDVTEVNGVQTSIRAANVLSNLTPWEIQSRLFEGKTAATIVKKCGVNSLDAGTSAPAAAPAVPAAGAAGAGAAAGTGATAVGAAAGAEAAQKSLKTLKESATKLVRETTDDLNAKAIDTSSQTPRSPPYSRTSDLESQFDGFNINTIERYFPGFKNLWEQLDASLRAVVDVDSDTFNEIFEMQTELFDQLVLLRNGIDAANSASDTLRRMLGDMFDAVSFTDGTASEVLARADAERLLDQYRTLKLNEMLGKLLDTADASVRRQIAQWGETLPKVMDALRKLDFEAVDFFALFEGGDFGDAGRFVQLQEQFNEVFDLLPADLIESFRSNPTAAIDMLIDMRAIADMTLDSWSLGNLAAYRDYVRNVANDAANLFSIDPDELIQSLGLDEYQAAIYNSRFDRIFLSGGVAALVYVLMLPFVALEDS